MRSLLFSRSEDLRHGAIRSRMIWHFRRISLSVTCGNVEIRVFARSSEFAGGHGGYAAVIRGQEETVGITGGRTAGSGAS